MLPLRKAILASGQRITALSTGCSDNDIGGAVEDGDGIGTFDSSNDDDDGGDDGGCGRCSGGGGNWISASLARNTACHGAASTVAAAGPNDSSLERLRGPALTLASSRAGIHLNREGSTEVVEVATRSIDSPMPSPAPACSGGGGGGCGDSVPPGGAGACADLWQQLQQQHRVFREVARRKWWIVVVPLLLCLLLCGLGVFGVAYASAKYTEQLRDYAKGALASTAVSTVAGQLELATFAVMTLSAYLTQQPNCSQLDYQYGKLAEVIFQWDAKQAVYQLQAMPAAVVKYIHPSPAPDLAAQLIGRDILQLPQYRNDTIKQIRARDQRLLLGPYNLLEGFKAMFVTYALFLPAPDPLYDWGCAVQPYECPPDTCWVTDEETGQQLKLWGMATSLVRLDVLKEGFGFQQYEQQGYLFRLWQQADEINREALIDGSEEPPHDPVSLTFEKYNLQWVFEVAPAGGWVPAWRNPCIAAVVVGSVMVSALVLWLLLTREKHNLLLRAMLPRKVIRQLQRGEQTVVEEYMDPVTILFTDIVSYTEVASQLTPLQVVRLLNELYTEFDALTDKHGVYKVETIGDAFMCVSGCPLREDPVQAAVRMAGMAQDMISLVGRFVAKVAGEEMKVQIRIGLHSGPVVAGVIGQRMPRYCLFGDTVNTASRMESNSAPMAINISSVTADLLKAAGAVVVPSYMGGQGGTPPPPRRQLHIQQLQQRPGRCPSGLLGGALLTPSPPSPPPSLLSAPSPLPPRLAPSPPPTRLALSQPPSQSVPSPLMLTLAHLPHRRSPPDDAPQASQPLPQQQQQQQQQQCLEEPQLVLQHMHAGSYREQQQQLKLQRQQQHQQPHNQQQQPLQQLLLTDARPPEDCGAAKGCAGVVEAGGGAAGMPAPVALGVTAAGSRCSSVCVETSAAAPRPAAGSLLVLHSRGTIHIKGKGPMVCYWLDRTPYDNAD